MTTEANKATARRFVDEVVNRGNLAVIDELLAPDFVNQSAPPGVPPTREGTKTFFAMLRGAFPDLHVTIDDVIAEGENVVLRTTSHGTMKGEFAGMPPSGKSATWASVHILRFANGKQVVHWAVDDQLGMLQQLGFAEAPGQPTVAEARSPRSAAASRLAAQSKIHHLESPHVGMLAPHVRSDARDHAGKQIAGPAEGSR